MASKFSRIAQIGSMTTRVGTSYLGQRVAALFQDEGARKASLDKVHTDNATRIVANLGALKGAAMKVGQAVAQVADGLDLPAEARAILGTLHDKAEPVAFASIKARVEAELGGGVDSLFRRFDPEPLGTASLGQAHAAELPDGTQVVVKVLHEGIEGSVESDLGALKRMFVAGRVLRRDREEIDAIFAEISERLEEELDYHKEAANLLEFRRYFADTPGLRIPFVHEGWSTKRVLTMERLPGRPLPVFAATAPDAAKQKAGRILANAFMKMQYVHRSLHADPHPGNYLFTPDGDVGILDFGCVKRFDASWMADYGQVGHLTMLDDREGAMRASLKIGCLTARDPGSEDVLWELCRVIGKPFRGGDFTMGGPDDDVQDLVTSMAPRLLAASKLSSPRELVFLHRALGGTHQILKVLKSRQDFRKLFEKYSGVCFAEQAAAKA
jgi:predicted unusual protein kinase regulating ubiquinone biosynthesis (AarF/ABC1/UbiB family)